ncbi:hypothetical protein J19TS2_32400 [Cohnella xylanilytica]|uniref:Uncharacterized protein n=1 Tax=Cohnella xylanilytica TaxID=557555 RepID=A0A841TZ82_9BACL|nr:hypothetical protein [Cohnella xylanilytica]MBB6690964.1 hypothetical protein [Cohnella xylanilytica]GIO13685.1 hypothetical protein J19TS2_32400 [Cohnella xylanilytica]
MVMIQHSPALKDAIKCLKGTKPSESSMIALNNDFALTPQESKAVMRQFKFKQSETKPLSHPYWL